MTRDTQKEVIVQSGSDAITLVRHIESSSDELVMLFCAALFATGYTPGVIASGLSQALVAFGGSDE